MAEPLTPNQIGEHSPAPNYQPTEEEQATISMVEKLFYQAKKSKELHDIKWLDYYKFYRGKQWVEKRPTYRHSEVINFIFSEVQNVLVLLTDNRPDIEVLPEDPTDLEFAEILTQILKSKWDNDLWAGVLAEAIVDSSIYGTAVGHVPWTPEKNDGLGDFEFETKDVFYFFPDPNARSFVNDKYCGSVILAEPKPIKQVKAENPEKAQYLAPDLQDLSSTFTDKEFLDDVVYKSPADNRVLIEADKAIKSGRPNQILEICAYLKSEEMIEEKVGEETDPASGLVKDLYQAKKKWPLGRKIKIANGVLLSDDRNPYDDGKFPFATLVDNALPRQLWGTGEVEQLRSPQMIVNKILSYTLDTLSIMGNPVWLIPSGSGIETDNITNQPGLNVEYSGDKAPDRLPGTPLPPYVLNLLDMMIERIWGKLASTTEISQGVAPNDQASGYAIKQLQEAAQTRIRGKGRNIELFLKQIGDLMVSRILQFYTVPRVIRLTENQGATKYFKFHIEEIPGESPEAPSQKMATVIPFHPVLDDQGQQTSQFIPGETRQIPLKSRLDVRINVGSTLPFAKVENRALAKDLFQLGVIDAEEYLTQIDYPRKEKIIERLNLQAQNAGGMNAPNAPNAPPGRAAGAATR